VALSGYIIVYYSLFRISIASQSDHKNPLLHRPKQNVPCKRKHESFVITTFRRGHAPPGNIYILKIICIFRTAQ
jgi:hypothetical protein